MMIIAISSILALTFLVWLADRLLKQRICPICAGVSMTWIGMLFARWLDYKIDPAILAMLIGASVVGIAYQLEKKLPRNRSQILWKSLFIPSGFVAGYSLVSSAWLVFTATLAWLLILTFAFFRLPGSSAKSSREVEDLEKKMEKCC